MLSKLRKIFRSRKNRRSIPEQEPVFLPSPTMFNPGLPNLRRFRILIIGKANAGKTTLLQKMCNTTEAPIIHDRYGREVDPSMLQPTDGRGEHDIENQMTFSSSPGFVFHDSRGFEAGSVRELEIVRKFITQRAKRTHLHNQLHAIWYCLPTDNDRPLSDAEMSFFEFGTGRVPVIAIFTKYDGMILKEYNKLRFDEHRSVKEAKELSLERADTLFTASEYYIKRLHTAKHPPAESLRLGAMHLPETQCDELSRKTVEALDSDTLQQLFVSVQENNIGLCTEYAIKHIVMGRLYMMRSRYFSPEDMKDFSRGLMGYYPHFWQAGYNYGQAGGLDSDGSSVEHQVPYYGEYRQFWDDEIDILDPVLPDLASKPYGLLPVLRLGAAILILSEDSYWLSKTTTSATEGFQIALSSYMESGRVFHVKDDIEKQFPGVDKGSTAPMVTEMVLERLLGLVYQYSTKK